MRERVSNAGPQIDNGSRVDGDGFDDWNSGGNEFNVENDPDAWRAMFAADVPIAIGSGAIAKRDLRLTREEAARRIGTHGRIGGYLNGLFDAWLDAHPDVVARMVAPNNWVIWDDVVTASLLGMTRAEQRERPAMAADLRFVHPATKRTLTWVTSIDAERLWNDLAVKLDAASP